VGRLVLRDRRDERGDLAAQEIKRLLREESELDGAGFESLCRVVLGALS